MPKALINGINLYYEVHGEGSPLIWCHEFAGDYRSWEPQVKFFSQRYRVITYNARGYPPSDVPTDPESYSQEQSVEDLLGLLKYLGIEQAHIGGLSMGGNVVLNFGLKYPQMAKSLIVAGTGSGSTDVESFKRHVEEIAHRIETEGISSLADFTRGPSRMQLLRKDPIGWQKFADQLFQHSEEGSALTIRGVQKRRPSIFDLEPKLRSLNVPTLIMVGDEDDLCIEPSIFMKRCIPMSGLVMFPQSGHPINLEEPDLFNRVVQNFLTAVEAGTWVKRDTGMASESLS